MLRIPIPYTPFRSRPPSSFSDRPNGSPSRRSAISAAFLTVYLYHWPIFQLGEQFKPDHSGHLYAIGLLAVILAVSVASYEFVEKPFLRLKDRIGVRRLRIACAAE